MIQRHELPQIPKEQYKEFIDFIENQGIRCIGASYPVGMLRPIQAHINRQKVDGMKTNPSTFNIPLIVNTDGYILDGHHRWIAKKELDPSSKINCISIDCDIDELIELGHEFDGSFTKTVYESTIYNDKNFIVRKTLVPVMENDTFSDCRDAEGVTIGLIDGIISISRILKQMDLSSANTKEALLDLSQDEDVNYVISQGKGLNNG